MSFFIFQKNLDNLDATLYRIAENQDDLNVLNIYLSSYTIIEDTQENFIAVKFQTKFPLKYNNNNIVYIDQTIIFSSKKELQNYINYFKNRIKEFTNNNPDHQLLSRWNDYYNQLSSLNLDNITYPLNKSLEQYFNDIGQPSYSILQLP